jgi:hypothetical protein
MKLFSRLASVAMLVFAECLVGCSPYRADQGAFLGGLLGAGSGAAIGSALGNTGAGAAIGAGVGALSGAVVGNELDTIDAQNRALIEQRLGRQVAARPVSVDEVIAMTRSGVDEELIVNHVRVHGVVAPLQSGDLILLQQQGVSKRVIAAMQMPPLQPAPSGPPVVQPVLVEPYPYVYWGPPYYYYRPHPYWPHWHPRPRSRISWGVTVGN